MVYEIRIAPSAERDIAKLPPHIQLTILDKLEQLEREPRPAGCEKVRGLGNHGVFRVRIERDYRIIYQVRDGAAWILVVKVADRKEVYRRVDDLKRLLER